MELPFDFFDLSDAWTDWTDLGVDYVSKGRENYKSEQIY